MSMIKQNEDFVLERLDHILFNKYVFSQKWQCTTSSHKKDIQGKRRSSERHWSREKPQDRSFKRESSRESKLVKAY